MSQARCCYWVGADEGVAAGITKDPGGGPVGPAAG